MGRELFEQAQRPPDPRWAAPCTTGRGCTCIRSATVQTALVLNRTVRLEANGESRWASVRKWSFPDSHCDPILYFTQRSRTWVTSFTSSARSSSSSLSCRFLGSARPSKKPADRDRPAAAQLRERAAVVDSIPDARERVTARGGRGRCACVACVADARHCRDRLEIERRVAREDLAMTRQLSVPLSCEPEASQRGEMLVSGAGLRPDRAA